MALTSERVATALDVTTAAAPAPVATTTSSKRRRRADDDDDDDDNVAPEVGDIVGAVDDSSTLRKPFVHFGKVLRVHPDKREVLLGHLVQQSSSS